ncbi:uncharacterized protein [Diabrotica undecimpunctata]|uniref:uncharacterized protein isoform X2 n=1 Tax=Diabrotica undecimpunctata TaxID=50387 RepID=UPI003B642ACC
MSGYRRAYSINEDNLILKLIVKGKFYYQTRGTILWKDLAQGGFFCQDRTWMSLQNRFEKKILPDITNPRYTLSSEEKHKICKAWKQTADNFSPDTDSSNDEDSLDCPITTTKEYL